MTPYVAGFFKAVYKIKWIALIFFIIYFASLLTFSVLSVINLKAGEAYSDKIYNYLITDKGYLQPQENPEVEIYNKVIFLLVSTSFDIGN
jgi:hypothetical protein